MRTHKIWKIHVDRDYGLNGWYYIEDHFFYSHGYAPSLWAAAVNWIRNIPTAFAVRKMMSSVDKKSKEEAKNHVVR